MAMSADYFTKLAKVESGNNPLAKAPTSSASGLYQFTRSTWEGLGYNWTDRFDVNTQNRAIQQLTSQNADYLSRAGIEVNDQTLYAAHFLGAQTAAKALGASSATALSNVVGSSAINANSFLKGMNVSDFENWLGRKMGDTVSKGVEKAKQGITDALDSAGKAALYANPATAPFVAAYDFGRNVLGIGKGDDDKQGPIEAVLDFFKKLFSKETAIRIIVVLVGILLVAAAVFAFTKSQAKG